MRPTGIVRIHAAKPLVLGSASPRRRELLAATNLPFLVCAAGIDEATLPGESVHSYLDRVTLGKLEAVRAVAPPHAGAILVADTVVVAPDGDILGKPADAAQASGRTVEVEARAMAERLAGATHSVSTRFVLAEGGMGGPVAHAQTVTTRVTLRALAPGEAAEYAASGEGKDKAGGYAVQGRAAAFIERIDGSYTGVVGLPVCEVLVALRSLGWW